MVYMGQRRLKETSRAIDKCELAYRACEDQETVNEFMGFDVQQGIRWQQGFLIWALVNQYTYHFMFKVSFRSVVQVLNSQSGHRSSDLESYDTPVWEVSSSRSWLSEWIYEL